MNEGSLVSLSALIVSHQNRAGSEGVVEEDSLSRRLYVAVPPEDFFFPSRVTDRHKDAVDDILRQLIETKHVKRNVLTAGLFYNGFRVCQFWGNGSAALAYQLQALHERIGTESFRALLMKTDLFVRRSKHVYQKIAGAFPSEKKKREVVAVNFQRILYDDRYIEEAGLDATFDATASFHSSLKQVNVRNLKVRYGLFLRTFCPVPKRGATRQETDPAHVRTFVWVCLTKLLGSSIPLVVKEMLGVFFRLQKHDTFRILPQWAATAACKARSRFRDRTPAEYLAWIFNYIVIPLVRNHFYVTESACYGSKLFYFRKIKWKEYVKHPLPVSMFYPQVCPLKFPARVHVLPKTSLSNLRIVAHFHKSAKQKLQPVLDVLMWELRQKKKQPLGCSVFGYRDVYKRLLEFKEKHPQGPYYLAKLDYKHAFDVIPHAPLLYIVSRLFTQESYTLRHITVGGKRKSLVNGDDNFWSGRGVMIDRGYGETIRRQQLIDRLTEHITRHYVTFRGRTYRQHVGIPQGSMLSTLLCSLYFGFFEQQDLNCCFMMRWVDDMLFISTSSSFVPKAPAGDTHASHKFEKASGGGGEKLAWCGLLIDSATLEVQWDYGRYEGQVLGDSVNFSGLEPHPGRAMRKKLQQYLDAKLDLRLLTSFNSRHVNLLNMFQAYYYVALKMKVMIKRLLFHRNESYLIRTVLWICGTRQTALAAFRHVFPRWKELLPKTTYYFSPKDIEALRFIIIL